MYKYSLKLAIAVIVFSITFDYLGAQEVAEQTFQLRGIKMEQHANPEYLYKIISVELWEKSLLQNEVLSSSLDKDFIHLAEEDQVTPIIQKFWNNMDCVVLKLTSNKLMGHLIYETNPGGTTKYYHLYDGIILLDAVKEITVVHNNQ